MLLFPMRPHAPGNLTPLKFHCVLMCPSVTQALISLAVTRKLNSPEYCKALNRPKARRPEANGPQWPAAQP